MQLIRRNTSIFVHQDVSWASYQWEFVSTLQRQALQRPWANHAGAEQGRRQLVDRSQPHVGNLSRRQQRSGKFFAAGARTKFNWPALIPATRPTELSSKQPLRTLKADESAAILGEHSLGGPHARAFFHGGCNACILLRGGCRKKFTNGPHRCPSDVALASNPIPTATALVT